MLALFVLVNRAVFGHGRADFVEGRAGFAFFGFQRTRQRARGAVSVRAGSGKGVKSAVGF